MKSLAEHDSIMDSGSVCLSSLYKKYLSGDNMFPSCGTTVHASSVNVL